jgi:predicted nucleic acid-binding protein
LAIYVIDSWPILEWLLDKEPVAARFEQLRFAMSYADCFAAALAVRFSAAVVTGDKEFLPLQDKGLISLEWLGA